MGLDNVAVRWPRTGERYEPVPPEEFADFDEIAQMPTVPPATAALAVAIARSSTVRATPYSRLVDLLLGLENVLHATDADADAEDPVIDPDGCGWIADGLERFAVAHRAHGEIVTFDSVGEVLRASLADGRLAEQQLRWLDARLHALRDAVGNPPGWNFARTEISVLGAFYRRCADSGFAVYASRPSA
ncbi:hypothetical protein ACK8GG_16280 [Micromonosporaceae bacterium DT55]|uniref:hypothetical protein n=1 Tax=Melissospora conviva TaxID=3388432 RepID=UPI003C1C9D28